jgi:serine protease
MAINRSCAAFRTVTRIMRPTWLVLGVVLGASIGTRAVSTEFSPARTHPGATAEFAADRVIVKFRDGSLGSSAQTKPAAEKVAALAIRTGIPVRQTRRIGPDLRILELGAPASRESLAVTLARLRADPEVEYADPDQRRYPHALPNDTLFPGQWYLQNAAVTPSAVDAVRAWDLTTGSTGVVIADLDTGVRFEHPDLGVAGLGGRLLPGFDFVSDRSIANDGDGWDSDASDPGDWVTTTEASTSQFSGCSASDSSWHGTRVAGIIGAVTNNSQGVAGLGWNGWILPARVLGKCGGFDSDILAAMLWAGGLAVDGAPANPYPARIINMSLGASGACPQSYLDVVNRLLARGVLVVASVGNEGSVVDAPANCPGVAGIGGLRHAGTKVGFSNLGPGVDLSAPGGNCVNAGAGQPCLYSIDTTTNLGTQAPRGSSYTDQFNFNVGTSFSAPIVAGIAALMTAINGHLAPAQIIARLQEGAARPFPASSDPTVPVCHVPSGPNDIQAAECVCTTQTCGAGMANAAGAALAASRPVAAVAVPSGVAPGQNVVLRGAGSAAACDRSVNRYSWSVVNGGATSPAIVGADTDTATVVAPASGSFTIRLTITDDAGRQDFADVLVSSNSATTAAPAAAGGTACPTPISVVSQVTVAVSPTSASAHAGGGTQTFVATVANTADSRVTWLVNGIAGGDTTVGTISTTGVYSAPATVPSPATVSVTAVSLADPSRSASAAVTITPPAPISRGSGGGGGRIDVLVLILLTWGAQRRTRT